MPAASASLPPTILTEAVAQVGGILILAKPENAGRLIYFRGIERARFRGAAAAGRHASRSRRG